MILSGKGWDKHDEGSSGEMEVCEYGIYHFEFEARRDEWMPSIDDREFVNSLMVRVTEPGKMAGWLSPPSRGIHGKDVDYEYVRLH